MGSVIDLENKEIDDSRKWYREPIIHYPFWIIFLITYLFRFKKMYDSDLLSEIESIFNLGFIFLVSGMWGIASNMFFFRIVFLSKFIYDNDYVNVSNLILIIVGVLILIPGMIVLKYRMLKVIFLLGM